MLRDILEGIADALRTSVAAPLAADDIDIIVEPRFVPSPSEAICLDVYPASPSRTSDSAGFGDIAGAYAVEVRARVAITEPTEAQDILTDMIDDTHALSVAAALQTNPTLGGWADDVYVDADAFSGVLAFGQPPLWVGATWRVLVEAAES